MSESSPLDETLSNRQYVRFKEYRLHWCNFILFQHFTKNGMLIGYRLIQYSKKAFQTVNDFTSYVDALEYILNDSNYKE